MSVAINQKIVGWDVVNPDEKLKPTVAKLLDREPVLTGKTYKLKTPLSEHALYVTINDQDGRPFEIFINCKAMEHFQWIVALTRVISAVFRHGGEVAFLVDELMAVVDPRGGYFFKGQYRASLVAEIGSVLKQHLTDLGLMVEDKSLAEAVKVMLAEKETPKTGLLVCQKCHEAALVVMDGCLTCTSCGDSKCS